MFLFPARARPFFFGPGPIPFFRPRSVLLGGTRLCFLVFSVFVVAAFAWLGLIFLYLLEAAFFPAQARFFCLAQVHPFLQPSPVLFQPKPVLVFLAWV